MITKVEIQNFQSHHNTVVDMVDGVNVIIGPSDAGKSSVFRAINWVVSNRPLGDSYRSEWGGDTSVVLHTSDGGVVERLRTDKRNSYIVNGTELKAFGSEPPAEVFETLRIDPYNVQSQMDAPFLMASSPGEVAQLLNRAASIDDIDRVVGGLKRSAAQIGRDTNYNKEQLLKFELQVQQFGYLDDLEVIVSEAEKALQEWDKLKQDARHLSDSILALQSLEQGLQRSAHVLDASPLVDEAFDLNETYQDLQKRNLVLQELTDDLIRVQEGLDQTAGVDDASTFMQAAEQAHAAMNTIMAQRANLWKLLERCSCLEESIDQLEEKTIVRLEKEYAELAPDTCPLCGNKMSKGV